MAAADIKFQLFWIKMGGYDAVDHKMTLNWFGK